MRTILANLKAWRGKGGVRPWLYLPFAFLSYAVLDLALRYEFRALGMLGFAHPAANLLTLGWCLLLTGLVCLLPRLFKKLTLCLCVLFFGLLTATHGILEHIFGRFFQFSALAYAKDGFAFAEAQYIRLPPLLLLSLLLSLLFLALALILAPGKGERARPVLSALFGIPLLLGGIVLVVFCQRTWLTPDTKLSWDDYADPAAVYESFTDSTASLLMAGLYQYTARDLALMLHLDKGISPEDAEALSAFVAERQAQNHDNEYSGLFAGKNLILIQLEAIDTWMLTETYMPNLWSIKQQSMVFENHYTPAYITAGTLNTEFMVNTGLLPATGNVSAKVYQRNAYPYSLANQFRTLGYDAASFHGSEGRVYNRGSFHPAIGYTYHGGSDIGMEDYTMDSHLLEAYEGMVREEPFLSFIITYSGHGPYHPGNGSYITHEEAAWALSPEGERDNYIYAVAGAMETDAFVGELFARLEQDGLLENTVVAFYADHYNYYMMNDEKCMEIKGVDTQNLLTHTDFFLYAKDRAPESVWKYTSSPDVLPTLANLFGLPDEGAVYLGSDAFSDGGGYVFFPDSAWLDGETYWSYGSPRDAQAAGRAEEIARTMRMSNLLLESDYYAP